jgi:hypothetical protein
LSKTKRKIKGALKNIIDIRRGLDMCAYSEFRDFVMDDQIGLRLAKRTEFTMPGTDIAI